MNQAISTVNFHGQELLVTTDHAGQGWVAIRPICEAIGVDAKRQQEKLESNPSFSQGHMSSTGSDSKQYQMLCIPVSQLNGWLFSINANKVRADVRENLLTYQRECQEVLFRHFMPQGGTNEEVVGLIHDLRTDMERGFETYATEMRRGLDTVQTDMQLGFDSVQAEVDELRELIHITISDSDATEIRRLIQRVKKEKHLDGRAIVGHVRKTLGTAGVYNTPNLLQVKNVLRNMLGTGVLGVVPTE